MTNNPERKNSAFLGFEPGSILTFQDICTTDVTTGRLPKKVGHLVKVNQKGYNARFNYSAWGGVFLRFSTPHCLLFGWIQGHEMTGCVGILSFVVDCHR